jgi:hypothetical protein
VKIGDLVVATSGQYEGAVGIVIGKKTFLDSWSEFEALVVLSEGKKKIWYEGDVRLSNEER